MPSRTSSPKRRHSSSPVSLPYDSLAYAIRCAALVIQQVQQGANLTECFEKEMATAKPQWTLQMRGAIRDCIWGTLRAYGTSLQIYQHYVHKAAPPVIEAILLIALHRLNIQTTDAHTTVNQAVNAAANLKPACKGLVNGVLRNYLREKEALHQRLQHDPVFNFQHPHWWLTTLQQDHPQQWQSIAQAGNSKPPMSLRVNVRQCSQAHYQQCLQAADIPFEVLDHGALWITHPVPAQTLPGFSDGQVSIQDAGAQFAAQLLAPCPGDNVLDACAAPGGKCAHLLETSDITMTALEINPQRAVYLQEYLARLKLKANIHIADAAQPPRWWNGELFDCILADVPCSASGVVRRNPDIKWHRRDTDIGTFVAQQRMILDNLWPMLKKGGKLLYATCSVFNAENTAQIEAFCQRHNDAEWSKNKQTFLQLYPNHQHDGFFYARLTKAL